MDDFQSSLMIGDEQRIPILCLQTIGGRFSLGIEIVGVGMRKRESNRSKCLSASREDVMRKQSGRQFGRGSTGFADFLSKIVDG